MTLSSDTKINLGLAITLLCAQAWIWKIVSDSGEKSAAEISEIRDEVQDAYVSKEVLAAQLEALKVQLQSVEHQVQQQTDRLREDILRVERRLDGK